VTLFDDLLGRLADGGVEFVVIGGFAAVAHGSAHPTTDLDVLYDRDPCNLGRIATALAPIRPYLRGAPPGLPFELDADALRRGLNFTLSTTLGDLVLLGEIPGVGGFLEASRNAVTVEVFGRPVRVLSLDDLVRAKRAAGRPKDLARLAELELLRDRA
jgi:hypothetical protein